MTEIKSLTGKWKGEFTLGVEYGDEAGQSTIFELNIKDDNGTFSGTCIDEDTKDLFTEPITVTGFWNQEIVSFVKQYPYAYYSNEQGEIVIDKTKRDPEINYTGYYDNLLNRFEGGFEFVEDSLI